MAIQQIKLKNHGGRRPKVTHSGLEGASCTHVAVRHAVFKELQAETEGEEKTHRPLAHCKS